MADGAQTYHTRNNRSSQVIGSQAEAGYAAQPAPAGCSAGRILPNSCYNRAAAIRRHCTDTDVLQVEGGFPKYGNDEEAVDDIAVWIADTFSSHLSRQHTYRDSIPTLSVLTITSSK